MIETLLYYDGQADVNTFEEYPQFLKYDRTDSRVSPFTSADAEAEAKRTVLENIFHVLRNLTSKIRAFIKRFLLT